MALILQIQAVLLWPLGGRELGNYLFFLASLLLLALLELHSLHNGVKLVRKFFIEAVA